MPSLLHLGLAAMLFATASAAPVRSGFTVHQVAKNKGFIRSGPRVNAETYLKYGKSMPKDVAHAFATQQGTVSANPEEYDSEYLSPVTIGGQTLNLDFDTGSADLWVYSSELSASAQKGHDIYDPAKSSTAVKKSGYTWSIVYGDGSSAKGNVYADTVTVGGVTATSQAVELATSLSSAFLADTNNDGLLGLSFSSINTGMCCFPEKPSHTDCCSSVPDSSKDVLRQRQGNLAISTVRSYPEEGPTRNIRLRIHRFVQVHWLNLLHYREDLSGLLGVHWHRVCCRIRVLCHFLDRCHRRYRHHAPISSNHNSNCILCQGIWIIVQQCVRWLYLPVLSNFAKLHGWNWNLSWCHPGILYQLCPATGRKLQYVSPETLLYAD